MKIRTLALHALARAALVAACLPMAWAADPKASQYYEDALVRFEKRDVKGTIVQLKNAIRLDRKMLSAHVLMGRALLANGEMNAAEAAFDEALRQGVNPAEVVVPLADALTAQGKPGLILSQPRFAHAGLPPDLQARLLLIKAAAASDVGSPKDALRYIEEARALDAKGADSWAAEVPVRVRARQLPEARAAAEKAVALDPNSPRAAYQLASVVHVSGDLPAAIQLYTRTLSLKPDHVDALVARAGIDVDLKRYDEAAADVQAARKSDPQDPRSAYLSALLYERLGQQAEAKKALNQVTNLLDPYPIDYIRYRPQLLMLGGMSHFALAQYEKAKPYLEMVVRQDPNSAVSKLLAQIYLQEKRVDRAVESLEAYLRLFPNDRQASLLLASSQMALGRYPQATQLMEATLKRGDDPSARALLGMSLLRSGKFEPGAAALEATLKADPGQVQAGVALAGLYIASGQGGDAARVARLMLKQQPKNPGLSNLLGSALAAQGDAKAARQAFEAALALDAKFDEPLLNLARLDIDEKGFESAQTRLNTLLARDEKNVDAAMETARLYSARGQADQALRWLQRADDSSGARLQPALQMVDFHLARNRPDLAAEVIKRLQNRAPDALAVLLAQARVQLASGQAGDARTTLNRTSTLLAYDAAALTQIAALQLQADNVPGAAHALDKALAERPDHLRARALRSTVYLLQNEPGKAEQLARAVLASDPKIGLGHTLMGDLARSRKQIPAAVDAYQRAHEIDRNSDSLLRLFNATDVNQHIAAVGLAEQWLRTKPQDVAVWRALANSQARSGNMAAAKTAYQSLVTRAPRDAEALNNLAIVLVALRDPDAVKVADQALALRPQTPHIIGTAGWAAFHAGQPERAVQLLRDARLRDPGNPGTHYFLGAVLAQQGRKPEAKEELEAALRGGPGFAYAKQAQALLRTLQ